MLTETLLNHKSSSWYKKERKKTIGKVVLGEHLASVPGIHIEISRLVGILLLGIIYVDQAENFIELNSLASTCFLAFLCKQENRLDT